MQRDTMDRNKKALDKMSFKQRKREWKNARKRLEPENDYLEAMVKNLELKLRHKELIERFRGEYEKEIEDIEDNPELKKEIEERAQEIDKEREEE